MFGPIRGPWPDEEWKGWWGKEPPYHVPVFVLTHHARETKVMQGGTSFIFVTDGIEVALEQARAAAGDKDVHLAGGASVIQQYLKAGLLDELQVHVAPVLLGDGVSLFDRLGIDATRLEASRVIFSPSVTHLRFQVPRGASTLD
jgi:dihydrofolate reductase